MVERLTPQSYSLFRAYSLMHPRRLLGMVRRASREFAAQRVLDRISSRTFAEIFPESLKGGCVQIKRSAAFASESYNVKPHEFTMLGEIARIERPHTAFEIGTFDGRTTAFMAEACEELTQIYTLDLPAEDSRISDPQAHSKTIGKHFRDRNYANRISQLWGDSLTFDYSPYFGKIDLAFIDAVHDRTHVRSDTQSMLKCVRPGGIIAWHDVNLDFPGVIAGILDVVGAEMIQHIAGTSLAVMRVPGSRDKALKNAE
jgi:predicted O-methyltransferase YrrM